MLRKLSIAFISLSLVVGFAGCKSAPKTDDSEGGVGSTDINQGDANTMGDSDSGKAMGMQTVYFKYDSFEIDSDGRAAINTNVEILKANPSVKVQIEGHCDQRGGIQYNIALGE
jgi:peptidoglycan-associated lipoprotein